MATVRKTCTLSNMKQLFDLNGESTNFDITFSVTSKNGEPFDCVVADQTMIDNEAELQYKQASNGHMSGNITQDKNVYQNYFLVLKAEQPCECEIQITKKEIPGKPVIPPMQPQQAMAPPKSSGINWKFWIILGVLVVGGIVLFYMYNSGEKKGSKSSMDLLDDDKMSSNQDVAIGDNNNNNNNSYFSPAPSHHSSVAPSASSSSSALYDNNNLVQRLKKLHMH